MEWVSYHWRVESVVAKCWISFAAAHLFPVVLHYPSVDQVASPLPCDIHVSIMNFFSSTFPSVKEESKESLSHRESEDSGRASLLSHSDDGEKLPLSDGMSYRRPRTYWFWVAQTVFFLFSLSMLVYSLFALRHQNRQGWEEIFTPCKLACSGHVCSFISYILRC